MPSSYPCSATVPTITLPPSHVHLSSPNKSQGLPDTGKGTRVVSNPVLHADPAVVGLLKQEPLTSGPLHPRQSNPDGLHPPLNQSGQPGPVRAGYRPPNPPLGRVPGWSKSSSAPDGSASAPGRLPRAAPCRPKLIRVFLISKGCSCTVHLFIFGMRLLDPSGVRVDPTAATNVTAGQVWRRLLGEMRTQTHGIKFPGDLYLGQLNSVRYPNEGSLIDIYIHVILND